MKAKSGSKIQTHQHFRNEDWPQVHPQPRRLHWSALIAQKLERLRIPELTQGSILKPGTKAARTVTILTSKVHVKELKAFEKQLGEELAKRALALDQEFFGDFTKALSEKAESRSSWREPVYSFLIKHSREIDAFETEDEAWNWSSRQPEIINLPVRKSEFIDVLRKANFRETRVK